ncbi:MAG: ABC transporter ATP-binding protein [Clostridia bacterium]|nr:ABC transporter ATP-binding protein [Clostridia bacterium]
MSEAVSKNEVLRLENITMQFGGVVAINNLSLVVNQGEIVALIGPNGAGKTTAFNCVTGVYEPTNGMVYFHGKPIVVNHPQGKMIKQYGGINGDLYKDRKPVVYTPDRITHMGIARTFQNIRLFKSQTAFENVLIGTHLRRTSNMFTATFRLNAKEEKALREKAWSLLEEVGLADVGNELATSLPYGKQRRLEIARALATDPTLLLLDEPAAGMNPQETDELGEFIVEIKNKFDLTVFMIEHHMNLVMDISDRIYVLDFGKQIAEGTPEEIQKNPVVIAAYLGVDEE